MDDLISDLIGGVLDFATEAVKNERAKKSKEALMRLSAPDFLIGEELRFIRGEDVPAATLYHIGVRYYNGTMPGGPQDKERAALYYKHAARMNFSQAQFALAMMMINEEGGEFYHDGAPELLMEAAESGYVEAMTELGNLICSGIWINDPELAAGWYENAAEAGSQESMQKLCYLYLYEEAVKDIDKFGFWAGKILECEGKDRLKTIRAMKEAGYGLPVSLAFGYYEGEYGKEKDLVKAAYWMKKAAQSGDTKAMFVYGHMTEFGEGGLYPSKDEAKIWYKKAAEDWDSDAKKALRRLKDEERSGSR